MSINRGRKHERVSHISVNSFVTVVAIVERGCGKDLKGLIYERPSVRKNKRIEKDNVYDK